MKTLRAFSLLFHFLLFLFVSLSHALDTLNPSEVLQSNESLVSVSGVFELGFFSGGDSSNKYLGIWLKNDKNKKAVWVANRESPLVDSTGFLKIRQDGNLVISDRRRTEIIMNSDALAWSNETTAKILDSGNLVLMEREKIIWQSFDYPTDTFLPGMKLGWFNVDTEQLRLQFLVSWLSPFDPSFGYFSLGLDPVNRTQFNIWRKDGAYQQIGFWDGNAFRLFFQSSVKNHNFTFVSNGKEIYLTFMNKESNVFSWFVLGSDGLINQFRMVGQEISTVNYSLCNDTLKSNSSGCLVMMPTICRDGDQFSDVRGLMQSSNVVSWRARSGLKDCEMICRSNCSCVAYTSLDDDEGIECQLFFGNKTDVLDTKGRGNHTIYLRGNVPNSAGQRKRKLLMIVTTVVLPLTLLIMIFLAFCKQRKCCCLGIDWTQEDMSNTLPLFSMPLSKIRDVSNGDIIEYQRKKDHELQLLSFSSVVAATDNFSASNKLGEGGFGPVYKGKMQGCEIAVKRLSKNSGQGLVEFKNEIELISKLQHTNLVKLLGCCIQREEKILIYEYMPNKSLDFFIFDQMKRPMLDWKRRRHIIDGIAQGLLYLHKYSRLRIIHRDLKTSNILLDSYMNPKISDFGLARIFYGNESRTKTRRVVGTLGYMSPEYAIYGLFSTKSDVFSFGVILLEIISGRKNSVFHDPNSSLNLLGHAWELWNCGKCMDFMDQTLLDANSCSTSDVMVCIQVGLLCVQKSAEDRPTMSDVVSMLSNEGVSLVAPKRPAFSILSSAANDSLSAAQNPSQNLATISIVEGR